MDESPPDIEDAGPSLGLDLPESLAASGGYQVLARKYRPARFSDLIGQEAMVRTLTNAFAAGRIAHAYMLTGVRGVGKTTTARLIARALNYKTDAADAPSITLDPPGVHCEAIQKSSHVDVMEMDAASRTGVGDIREILEGVRYAPVSARYKVYIIDEVHMLSASAFNALLKTLEEPPPHVKFIFATTEIRKVPVTVLSRCQRFDLKRVERTVLTAHLAKICEAEGVKVEAEGLTLIARAAEGSVRDALSLLDQAIVQGGGADAPVSAAQVRDMLGLADRARVLDLLDMALKGEAGPALAEMASLYESGADPAVIVRDLLDYTHACARVQAAGAEADLGEAKETAQRIAEIAGRLSPAQTGRLWKLLLTGLDDVRQAPDPLAAAEMTLLRLISAAALPPPEDAARLLAGRAPAGDAPVKEPAPAPQADPEPEPAAFAAPPEDPAHDDEETPPPAGDRADAPQSLEETAALIAAKKDVKLLFEVERYVRLVSFKPGRIVFEPGDGAPPDLAQRLSKRLLEWTGAPWMALADANARGAETLGERRRREARETLEAAAMAPAVAEALKLFPGAEVIAVHETGAPAQDAKTDKSAETRR
ncbi:MAG: DNA polymerase III subunit gamma/tau [Maricaulaceae bacterium]|nr:DNA polymerase III subunit gamma/tau [Maricaulaceae bacterium]